ncbi:hypothetical protein OH76DRAFT_1354138 [Lentinus brumalis]|uniref:Uncharacterized protein n=1 Tax=Lentinus brumalis TaxID=2498619 RepID=A0A371D4Q9_9APHY|nr:hypothetical protein OH76DRAFT_1354138 [Polyporus brumalis]
MSAFEPEVVLEIILNTLHPSKRTAFAAKWNASVKDRALKWIAHRPSQWHMKAQLEWEASIVEYVGYVYDLTKLHGNSKKSVPPTLPPGIPYYGPRFIPPTYSHLSKRENAPRIQPEFAYLRPLNVVHPFYYGDLKKCPQCGSLDVLWDSWTNTGHRSLHGVRTEESAIGYQLRCKVCEKRALAQSEGDANAKPIRHCFATTSSVFWEKWEHWELPRTSAALTHPSVMRLY